MSTARALIAEDEPLLAQALAAELHAVWPALQLIGIAPDGDEALARIQAQRPDVVFLDVRMPGLSGLEVAEALAEDGEAGSAPPLIVFVTAYDEFALSAFEHAAVDYLLKPVSRERLTRAVQRLQQRLATRRATVEDLAAQLREILDRQGPGAGQGEGARSAPAAGAAPADAPLRSFRVGIGDSVRFVPVDSVLYLQAADKYVNVVTAQGEWLIREPLKDLMPRLDPGRFQQIHRGTVVNLDAVREALHDEAGRTFLVVRDRTERLAVSRIHAHRFKAM